MSAIKLIAYHQCRDDFVGHLFDSDHVSAGLRVDDAFFFLPTHHDGFLPMSDAAHPLLLALRSQSGVWVGSDHGWDWMEGKTFRGRVEEKNGKKIMVSVKTFRSLPFYAHLLSKILVEKSYISCVDSTFYFKQFLLS